MEKVKYIAIYKQNDVAHDNNIYCESLEELYIFIENFIKHSWYNNLYEFLEDYEICNVGHCKLDKFKNNYKNYFNRKEVQNEK